MIEGRHGIVVHCLQLTEMVERIMDIELIGGMGNTIQQPQFQQEHVAQIGSDSCRLQGPRRQRGGQEVWRKYEEWSPVRLGRTGDPGMCWPFAKFDPSVRYA